MRPFKFLLYITAVASVGLLLGGCLKVGPDYEPPEVKTPQNWRVPDSPHLVPGEADIRSWWEVFRDPLLVSLVNQAAASNLDLKSAVAKVKEARARLGVARGGLLPSAEAAGNATRQRGSENTFTPAGFTYDTYDGSLGGSWEIDLFGRIRRSVEAARADYQASQEDRVGVMVSLYAEMASSYIQVRTIQARLAAAEKNILSQKEVLELTKVRFKNGLATGLDVSQAEQVLASSEAEVPLLYDSLNQAANAVALLLARPPGAVEAELADPRPIPSPPARVALGLPADLLRQRPDVRSAERQLAAATARIGEATADLYPTFSLVGSIGLASKETGTLFNSGSRYYSFGPGFTWNLFAGGSIRAQIKVQDALTEQALLAYELSVLTALNEVDNAIIGFFQQGRRVEALQRSVTAAERTLELSLRLYKEGLKDFQSVLDAQRSLFDADNQLAQARGQLASGLVTLYKAMGGGWQAGRQPSEPDDIYETAPRRTAQAPAAQLVSGNP